MEAMLTIFQVITLEGWVKLMYNVNLITFNFDSIKMGMQTT